MHNLDKGLLCASILTIVILHQRLRRVGFFPRFSAADWFTSERQVSLERKQHIISTEVSLLQKQPWGHKMAPRKSHAAFVFHFC